MKFLKLCIEKLREEKERLKRIQELEDMEEVTKRQIAGQHETITAECSAGFGDGRIRELEDLEEGMKREILDTEWGVAGN